MARWPRAAAALGDGPAFTLEVGRRGAPTLRATDGRFLHSRYDPAAEARRRVEAAGLGPGDSAAVFAAGLGYVAIAAAEAVAPSGRLLVLEPFPRALAAGLVALDWSPVLDLAGADVVAAADPAAFAAALAEVDVEGVGALLVNESALPLLDAAWAPVRARMEDHLLRGRSARRFGGEMAANRRANAARIVAARPVRGLFGALAQTAGATAVVAGAGPGLLDEAEALVAARDRCLVLAAAAALGPLASAGIEPDIAVLTDPQAVCAAQVAGRRTPLVAFPSSSAAAVAAAAGPLVGAVQTGEGGAAWAPVRAALGELEAGGSVVTTALDLAVRMGATTVALAGVDLCWTERFHAPGYDRDEAAAAASGRFATLETARRRERPRESSEETAVDGAPVRTAPNLVAYRRWIESRIRRSAGAPGRPIRFVQTARRGLPIRGASAARLADVLASAGPVPRLALPPPLDLDPATRAAWAEVLAR